MSTIDTSFPNRRHTCVVARAKKAAAILCKGVSFHFSRACPAPHRRLYMGEAGVDRFHIAHVLNHRSVTHSTVTAIYDRYLNMWNTCFMFIRNTSKLTDK